MKKKLILLPVFLMILVLGLNSFAQEFDENFRDDFAGFNEDFDERFGEDFDESERFDDREGRNERFEEEFGYEFRNVRKQDVPFEIVFELLGDEIDEREIIPYCGNPERIADIIIGKAKEKIGSVENACDHATEMESSCREGIEFHCSFGPNLDDAIDERDRLEMQAFSCPVNEQAIIDLCVLQSRENLAYETEYIEQNCEFQWEDYGQQDQKFCEQSLRHNICDEDKFMDDCLQRWGAYECKDVPFPDEDCNGYWDQEYDNNGCIINYYCVESFSCPQVNVPDCGDNAYAEDFYDGQGCVYYQCVEQQGCPAVRIDSCPGNERQEFHYDDKGCLTGYGCVNNDVCGDGVCSGNEDENSCVEDCMQCPFTDEEAERLANECIQHNGAPEKVVEGECVVDVTCTIHEGNSITGNVVGITGRQVLDDYDDFVGQCEREWADQQIFCDQQDDCSKESFIDSCVERDKMQFERESGRAEQRCELDARYQIRDMQRECSRMQKDIDRCYEEGERRCSQFEGISDTCRERLNEENLRAYIIKEAKARCKFADEYFQETVYSTTKPKQVIDRILELKERGVPGEFTGILDEEAEQLLGVSDSLEELGEREQQKGFAYKVRLFLGFAKDIEEGEIQRLELSRQSLESSIRSLSSLVEQVEDETAKAILAVQIADLERQKVDIEGLIEQKKKKSKGLLRLFGLLG